MSPLEEIQLVITTETIISNTTSNTTSLKPGNEILGTAFEVIVIAVQIVIMLGMGAIITITDIIEHFKRPVSIFIAIVSQFIAMPASAFGLINLAQFPTNVALSAMILATCPGGSSSNLFAQICNGDVPLSIMLTTVSTVLAIGFMPLNLWIYTRKWSSGDELKVPYISIATTLVLILVPLFFGMLAKRFAPKLANAINKIGSVLGMVLIWISVVLQCIMHPQAFANGWKLWLIAAAIPTAGFLIGYSLAFISRQGPKQRITISLETGMQSISLATTIVASSFPKWMHGEMTPILIMCGIYLNGSAVILATAVRIPGLFKRKTIEITPIIKKNAKFVNTIT